MNFIMFMGSSYELQNVYSGFLPFWQLHFMPNILMFLNILMFFNILNLTKVVIYSIQTYFKHINDRSFVLTNKTILSLKSKEYFLVFSSSLLVTNDFRYSYWSM